MDYKLLNGADLAYLGDAVYELYVREYLLNKNITKTKELNKLAINFVSAKAHALIFNSIKDFLNEDEMAIYLRGRNKAPSNHRKNVNRSDYLISSGFEAIIGYLYLSKNTSRLNEILDKSISIVENNLC